jgi:hypothetical protein
MYTCLLEHLRGRGVECNGVEFGEEGRNEAVRQDISAYGARDAFGQRTDFHTEVVAQVEDELDIILHDIGLELSQLLLQEM